MADSSWTTAAGLPATFKALGQEWRFTADCLAVFSHAEQLALAWGRAQLQAVLDTFPDRGVPGTDDAEEARKAKLEFAGWVREGEFGPPAGKQWVRYAATWEGKLAMMVASLRPHHPDITPGRLIDIAADNPDAFSIFVEQVSAKVKAFAAAATKAEATAATRLTPSGSPPG